MQRRRVTLIGFRACGKSTVGRLLAARLAWPFLDADAELERRTGRRIPDIFAADGEPAFRELEAQTLQAVLAGDGPLVLATGGGAVLREDNRDLLAERGGLVCFIDTPIAIIQARLARNAGDRPSLTGASVADEAARLHAMRMPLYRSAAAVTAPGGLAASGIAAYIAGRIEKT